MNIREWIQTVYVLRAFRDHAVTLRAVWLGGSWPLRRFTMRLFIHISEIFICITSAQRSTNVNVAKVKG